MSLTVLDARATAAALPWPGLIDALRAMLARRRAGLAQSPERLAVPLAGGVLLAMPATDGEYASTKLVTVCADNAARGLPTLLGEVLLMRADTGERLLMLDGPTVTARRTAALSALAALTLAPPPAAAGRAAAGQPGPTLLIIGSGVQGQAHLDAFTALLGVRRVLVASRTPGNAQAFAERARRAGIDCTAIADPGTALAEADYVVTGTTSHAPLFHDAPAFSGFVAAVGAFRPEMCELPAALVHRARLYIDDKAGGLHEAGDLIQAGVDWQTVRALEDTLAEGEPPADGPVVFKSVGQALWDLAACRLALTQTTAGRGG